MSFQQSSNIIPLLDHYDLVIYHKGCSDGIAASWVYWNILNDKGFVKVENENKYILEKESRSTEFYGTGAGQFPTNLDFANKNVLVVDICFNNEQIASLNSVVKSLTILDHHKSAMSELNRFFPLCSSWDKCNIGDKLITINTDKIHILFDMDRCGTELSWDHFHREKEIDTSSMASLSDTVKEFILSKGNTQKTVLDKKGRPWFIQVISDRDLWKWEDPRSKAIGNFMFQKGINTWETLNEALNCDVDDIDDMYNQGLFLLELEDKKVEAIIKNAILTTLTTPVTNKTYKVYLVGCSHIEASEVGNRLSKKEECDFACMWRYDCLENKFWMSARSNILLKPGSDLSKIAKEFSGGGHSQASGFALDNCNEGLMKYFSKVV